MVQAGRPLGAVQRLATNPGGFIVGALYDRRGDIHAQLGGQQQYGISTPAGSPYVLAFTSLSGKRHGYHDLWDDDGVFHYFGEGQVGDMELTRGNRAVADHARNGKHLLVFQDLGGAYRFVGEFRCIGYYSLADVPDTVGARRTALVFKLGPIRDEVGEAVRTNATEWLVEPLSDGTMREVIRSVRTKQDLFRRRITGVELGCRALSGRSWALISPTAATVASSGKNKRSSSRITATASSRTGPGRPPWTRRDCSTKLLPPPQWTADRSLRGSRLRRSAGLTEAP